MAHARTASRRNIAAPRALLPNEPCSVTSPHEAALTAQYLLPALPALQHCLQQLRREIDAELQPRQPIKLGKPYPLGQCLEISQALQHRLGQAPSPSWDGVALQGWQALQQFVQAGGLLRQVWGDLRGEFFQNAFQIGTLYVDVANDTVVVTKPQVEILPFAQAQLTAIQDFVHFRRLAQRYWQHTVLPNHVMPQLAPYCPLLHVRPDGLLQVHEATNYMVALAARERFRASEAVLHEAPLAQPIFERVCAALAHTGVPLPSSAEQGREWALRACRQLRKAPPDADALRQAITTVQLLNQALVRFAAPQDCDGQPVQAPAASVPRHEVANGVPAQITIGSQTYAVSALPTTAQVQWAALQATDQHLSRLQQHVQELQKVRQQHWESLLALLPPATNSVSG